MIRIEDLALSILTKTGEVVAYFSLLNDTIKFEEDDKKTRNRINRKIPFVKQRNHYPAVKIGRLAVSENYAHQGIGEQILQYVKALFAFGNRAGCRFLTVDAYADAVSFYENKGGFKFFTETDINDDTLMPRYLHIPHTPDTARTLTLSGRNCLAVSGIVTPP